MLIKMAVLERIVSGELDLAFRRWTRPTVKAGGQLTTALGVMRIESVERVSEAELTAAEARRAGFSSREALVDELARRPEGDVFRVALRLEGADPRVALRASDTLSATERADLALRLGRLDRASTTGPWTRAVLGLIARAPGHRAGDLAAQGGYEKEWLKLNVRKLKNLGLTESLDVGYRLSPRGEAFLADEPR